MRVGPAIKCSSPASWAAAAPTKRSTSTCSTVACGFPPAAGSGTGTNRSPLGTNRVYVHCGDELSQENWLSGLRAGRVVVTNGPLLRTTVEGQPPGHVFHLDEGQSHQFQIALSLSFYEKAPVEYLEIVKNGRVEYEVRLDSWPRSPANCRH